MTRWTTRFATLTLGLGTAASLLLPADAQGQRRPTRTETLVGEQIESGGYGGPVIRFTQMYDDFAVMVGGQGGWVINRSFTLGGAGYGLATQPSTGLVDVAGAPVDLLMGYGGLVMEYIHDSWALVHWSAQVLIGAGGAEYEDQDGEKLEDDGFFVAEPAVGVELNVTDFMRVNLGASYRFVSDVDLTLTSDGDFSGPAGVLLFKFGVY